MANIASGFGSVHSMAPLHAKWGWIVALGIVYVVAGFIALGSVVMATAAAVWVVGIMMIIAGVTEVISAFQVKTWGRFFFWLLLGVLYIFAGFVAFENTLLTAIWLTLILGAALVASGIVRVFLGFNMRGARPGCGWSSPASSRCCWASSYSPIGPTRGSTRLKSFSASISCSRVRAGSGSAWACATHKAA